MARPAAIGLARSSATAARSPRARARRSTAGPSRRVVTYCHRGRRDGDDRRLSGCATRARRCTRLASAPVVSAGGPYSVAEGSQVTLHATATNAAGLPMTYTGTSAAASPRRRERDLQRGRRAGHEDGDRDRLHVHRRVHERERDDPATITSRTWRRRRRSRHPPTVRSSARAPTSRSAARSPTPACSTRTPRTWTVDGTTTQGNVTPSTNGSGSAAATWTPSGGRALSAVADGDGQGRRHDAPSPAGRSSCTTPGAGSVCGARRADRPGRELVLFEFDARYRDRDSDAERKRRAARAAPDAARRRSSTGSWSRRRASSSRATAGSTDRNGYRFRLDRRHRPPDKLRVEVWSPGRRAALRLVAAAGARRRHRASVAP